MRRGLTGSLLALMLAGGTLAAATSKGRTDEVPRQVWIGAVRSEEGERVLPLEIDDISQVVAIDLDLVFDPVSVKVVEVRATRLLSGFLLLHNVVGDTLKIVAAGAQPNEGSGAFAEIVVRGPSSAFALARVSLNGDLIPVEYEKSDGETPLHDTAVSGEQAVPSGFRLDQNFPNPFNGTTTLTFCLPASSLVRLAVYNTTGQLVRILVSSRLPAGVHRISWDGRDDGGKSVSSGRYVARLEAGGFRKEIGMVLLR